MKEKQKTIYYCDFCKKYRLTRHSMLKHESSCTLNPNRICIVLGCDGGCPWCLFAKWRLGDDISEFSLNVEEEMQKWWAKKREDEVIKDGYRAIYG